MFPFWGGRTVPSSPPKAADHSVVDLLILVPSSVGCRLKFHRMLATVGCSALLTRLLPNAVCGALSRCSIDQIRSLLIELCRIVHESRYTVLEVILVRRVVIFVRRVKRLWLR